MLDETTHYGLLKTLGENPALSQRNLVKRLGVSLGNVNFCLNSLVEKGRLKIGNFRNSDDKPAYAYLLSPRGIEEKAHDCAVPQIQSRRIRATRTLSFLRMISAVGLKFRCLDKLHQIFHLSIRSL